MKFFEVNRPTCLSTDYSRIGVSYFLFQKYGCYPTGIGSNYGKVHWKLVLAGSCVTIEVEFCYAPVEEALALGYRLESYWMIVMGSPDLLVSVDHKPLVKIFPDKALEDTKNLRLFSLKECTLMTGST